MSATIAATPTRSLSPSTWFGHALIVAFAGSLAVFAVRVLVLGWASGYYALSFDARPDHPLHDILRPGGSTGVLLGFVGTALMVAMQLYTVRKWLPLRLPLGSPAWWLRFHITCGLFGPLLIVLHLGFYWPSGLVAVAFWCMLLVSASGAFGRYVYGHFPRGAAGNEMSLRAASAWIKELKTELVALTEQVDADRIGQAVRLAGDLEPVRGIPGLVALDLEVRRRSRKIRTLLADAGLPAESAADAHATLRDALRLQQGLSAYQVSQRLFRYWHLFHEPLARAMYLIAAWHIFSAIAFGGALETLSHWMR